MRTKLISYTSSHGIELFTYECPCGKGTICKEIDCTPGFGECDVWMRCNDCNKKYKLDTSKGVINWELVEI